MNDKLDEMQEEVNKLFEENGNKINDEILDKQIKINVLRNEMDIPDPSEELYNEYVQ